MIHNGTLMIFFSSKINITSRRVRRCLWNFFFLIEKNHELVLAKDTPRLPMSVHKKNFSPISLAVWPAIGDIYTNVLFYYIVSVVFYFLCCRIRNSILQKYSQYYVYTWRKNRLSGKN